MDAVPTARRTLDRRSGVQNPRDELAARLAAECTELARLEDERVATNGTADAADDRTGQAFVLARTHHERTAQRIVDCSFTGPLCFNESIVRNIIILG